MVEFPKCMADGITPTVEDVFFARSIVGAVRHGGVWVAPGCGASFTVFHDAEGGGGRLVYAPGSCQRGDVAEFIARTIAAFGAVGYSVFEAGAAAGAAVAAGGGAVGA